MTLTLDYANFVKATNSCTNITLAPMCCVLVHGAPIMTKVDDTFTSVFDFHG